MPTPPGRGLDVAKLKADMADPAVDKALKASLALGPQDRH